MTYPYGFRCVGRAGQRRWVNHGVALRAHAACEEDTQLEWLISAFQYGEVFRRLLETAHSEAGYSGKCWADRIWFDIDDDDNPRAALDSARRLDATILGRYAALDENDLLRFLSGSKGFHIGMPLLVDVEPAEDFNRIARRLAEGIAQLAEVKIDTGVYSKTRLFRAPNSRHPKSGLHKRRLSNDELMGLSLDRIRQLAASPEPFDWPDRTTLRCDLAAKDWIAAAELVRQEAEIKTRPHKEGDAPKLNRATLEFIRDGAEIGDRRRLLFSAAANLAEFGCPAALAHALLTDVALDCGVCPDDVFRQIECGLAHVKKGIVA